MIAPSIPAIGSAYPRAPLIELLRAQFTSLELLGASLTAKEWYAPAAVPGWSVIDVYAHVIGAESMLEGYELPYVRQDVAALPHVVNEVGVINETWIESLSHLAPEAVLDRFRRVAASRLRSLESSPQARFDEEEETPAGSAPYGRLLQVRVFDCWMHEQDVREGLGRPGHESGPCARAALGEAVQLLLPVIGPKADAEGAIVTIELTGPIRERITIAVDGEASLVSEHGGAGGVVADRGDEIEIPPADATVTLSSSLFLRLIGGRAGTLSTRLGPVDFDGDLDLASRVLTNLAVTH